FHCLCANAPPPRFRLVRVRLRSPRPQGALPPVRWYGTLENPARDVDEYRGEPRQCLRIAGSCVRDGSEDAWSCICLKTKVAPRSGCEQFRRVIVPGSIENVARRTLFDDFTTMHDDDAVADLAGDTQIVGD